MSTETNDKPSTYKDAAEAMQKALEAAQQEDDKQQGQDTKQEAHDIAEDIGLTPEDEIEIQNILNEVEQRRSQEQARNAELDVYNAWAAGVTPETQQYIQQQADRLAKQRESSKLVDDPTAENLQREYDKETGNERINLQDQLASGDVQPPERTKNVSLTLRPPVQSVNSDTFQNNFQVDWLNEEYLRKVYGLDVNAVPEPLAKGIERLINDHNRDLANANYFFKEAQKAFKARDHFKDQVLQQEWNEALRNEGVEPDKTTDALFREARGQMFDPQTGQKVPLPNVIQNMRRDYPKVFAASTPEQTPEQQPIAPPTPPQGTAVTRNPASANNATSGEKPRTFNDAKKAFHQALMDRKQDR